MQRKEPKKKKKLDQAAQQERKKNGEDEGILYLELSDLIRNLQEGDKAVQNDLQTKLGQALYDISLLCSQVKDLESFLEGRDRKT